MVPGCERGKGHNVEKVVDYLNSWRSLCHAISANRERTFGRCGLHHAAAQTTAEIWRWTRTTVFIEVASRFASDHPSAACGTFEA